MKTWPTMPMVQVTRLVTDGKHGDCEDEENSGYYFLSSKDLRDGRLHYDKPRQITYSDFLATHRRTNLEPGDILLANCGASIGRVGLAQADPRICKTTFQKSVSVIKANTNIVDNRFLYYFVCHKSALLIRLGNGAAQPNLLIGDLKRIEVPVPPLPLQQRIADILSAYDELIENNQRRIRILESIARALYREWFVHFRFPGHESVPRIASPFGEIPQGWEVMRLGDVADVNRAQINARNAPNELHYIDISAVSPGQINTLATYAFDDAPSRARRIVQHGDVLWSCVRPNRRSHAQVMHPEPDTIASTGFAVLTATKVPFTFLYFATTTDDFVAFLTNNATGAAYPAVSGSTFEKAELLIPPAPLLKNFGDATNPMAEQIHTLQRKVQNLRRTRDLLLPRLLSGQINVENFA
ncbi:restriction endonuclease subunit S [Pseudomonas protegens]|uniref:restriction endonuclease subunit S n=1 Tax=Pseudomonas protegens TaxID=380021 RepID=UPI0034D45F53